VAYDVHPAHLRRVSDEWTPTQMLAAMVEAADRKGGTHTRALRVVPGERPAALGPDWDDLSELGRRDCCCGPLRCRGLAVTSGQMNHSAGMASCVAGSRETALTGSAWPTER